METSLTGRSQSVPLNKIKRGITESASEVSSQVSDWASAAVDTSSEYLKTGRRYVEKNPAKSVGIAAAAGAIIGCLATLAICKD